MRLRLRSLVRDFKRIYSRKTLIFWMGFYVLLVAIAIFNMAFLSNQLMQFQAKRTAQDYIQLIKEARSLYTSDVVERLANHPEINFTHIYEQGDISAPLPATFLLNLSQRVSQRNKEVSFRLFSDYPFPWRREQGGATDAFEKYALKYLQEHPEQPFFRFENQSVLRYAEADLMKPSCVSCHNSHPQSPKRDWQEGDVRGVFDIKVPLASYRALTRRQLGFTFVTMSGLGGVGLVGLSYALKRNRQYAERLKAFNQGLEQEVAARTEELSTTLEVLQATQAELVYENERLKGEEHGFSYAYQVGGSLPLNASSYVVRQADRMLYQALRSGDYCFVLSSRQMGKSSLRVQQVKRLTADGVTCATVDITEIGSQRSTASQWYAGLVFVLARELKLLDQVDVRAWWKTHELLAPVQRLGLFFQEVVLVQISGQILIVLDEIDNVLNLDFPTGDLFILLRSCFEQRSLHSEYDRLSFLLLGVATPAQLIQDPQRTPFNIGQMIRLRGFALHEAQLLIQGLQEKTRYPQIVLKAVLDWTQGQPFLTQKLCQLISEQPDTIPFRQEASWVKQLVHEKILTDWERQDEPEHLRTIRDRLLYDDGFTQDRLKLLEALLFSGKVAACDSLTEQTLLLSGLVAELKGYIYIKNKIYLEIFNLKWIQNQN